MERNNSGNVPQRGDSYRKIVYFCLRIPPPAMSEKRRHSVSEQWHEAAAADGRVSGVSGTSGAADASGMASYGRSARGDAAGAENSGDDVSGFGAPTSAAAAGRGHASETPASGRDNVSGDAETPRPKRPSWVERNVAQVLSGNILTRAEVRRMYPYVLFIAVLMFLYICLLYTSPSPRDCS